MQKKQQLQSFIKQKLSQIDKKYQLKDQNNHHDLQKLKLATLRTSYSKILDTFLKNGQQLPKSHFQQAKFYFENGKIQQAINQAQIAKRKILTNQKNISQQKDKLIQKDLQQKIDLLLVDCYLKNNKSQDALGILDQIEIQQTNQNKEKYLVLKAKIYQELQNQALSKEVYKNLHQLVKNKYGTQTVQQGLCLVKIGKNCGHFKKFTQGIDLINQGMDILINNRYHNPLHVAKIYQSLAHMCCQIQDYQKQYSALICAVSMIKQLGESQEKKMVQILNKLIINLIKKNDKPKAFQFLVKMQEIQRKIYGESSEKLVKTIKRIISLLYELNRNVQAKRYQSQYDHLLGSAALHTGSRLNNSNTKNLLSPSNSQIKNLAMSKLNTK